MCEPLSEFRFGISPNLLNQPTDVARGSVNGRHNPLAPRHDPLKIEVQSFNQRPFALRFNSRFVPIGNLEGNQYANHDNEKVEKNCKLILFSNVLCDAAQKHRISLISTQGAEGCK